MKVVVNVDQRFERTPDGAVWTITQFPYSFWVRYLQVFDSVRIVARARDVERVADGALRVDGPQVEFFSLPYFHGMKQYLPQARKVQQVVRQSVRVEDALILRVGSPIGCWLDRARHPGQPFGAEVVSDPWDVFSPGAFPHPLRPLLRRYYARQLRGLCRRAIATSYVTREALQRRYPGSQARFTTDYSSIDLQASAYREMPRRYLSGPRPLRLITVGGLSHMYKGVDTLIAACAACLRNGVDLRLTVVGDGQFQAVLEAQAIEQRCREQIHFAGALPAGQAVREALDKADVFVLASRQEGLPRAMIEAMARGLPCLGTHVGGIPELIAAEDRFERDNATELAARISAVAGDVDRLNQMAERNWNRAADYRAELLQNRRIEFYEAVRQATQRWRAARAKPRSQEPNGSEQSIATVPSGCMDDVDGGGQADATSDLHNV